MNKNMLDDWLKENGAALHKSPFKYHMFFLLYKTFEKLDVDSEEKPANLKKQIDDTHARRSLFLVSILSEKELFALSLEERTMQQLQQMYPMSLIADAHIIAIDDHYFVINKKDARCLIGQHFAVMKALAAKEQLSNPIFVEVDKNGSLIID